MNIDGRKGVLMARGLRDGSGKATKERVMMVVVEGGWVGGATVDSNDFSFPFAWCILHQFGTSR